MKRTLIISSWAPPSIGGPKNMHALFSRLPDNKYRILTSYYGIDNYSAQNGQWLPGKYYFYDAPAILDTQKDRKILTKESAERRGVSALRHAVKRVGLIKVLLGPFLIFGQIMMIVRVGKKIIKEDGIEMLMGVSDFGPALIGTYRLHKKTGVPFVLHLYDLYVGNLFPFPGSLLARYYEPKLISAATKIIVTNETTKELYVKRYGESVREKFSVIYNSVPAEDYEPLEPWEGRAPNPPFSILFAGRIYWPQIEALKDMISAVSGMAENVVFNIYTPSPKDYLSQLGIKESNGVHIRVATPEEMLKLQRAADILFLPLSWHTKAPQIVETATPGKLTDYLATGRPILIYAPKGSAVVNYAKKYDCAFVVDTEDPAELQRVIKTIVSDTEGSSKKIANAMKAFAENHSAAKNAEKLRTLLS